MARDDRNLNPLEAALNQIAKISEDSSKSHRTKYLSEMTQAIRNSYSNYNMIKFYLKNIDPDMAFGISLFTSLILRSTFFLGSKTFLKVGIVKAMQIDRAAAMRAIKTSNSREIEIDTTIKELTFDVSWDGSKPFKKAEEIANQLVKKGILDCKTQAVQDRLIKRKIAPSRSKRKKSKYGGPV